MVVGGREPVKEVCSYLYQKMKELIEKRRNVKESGRESPVKSAELSELINRIKNSDIQACNMKRMQGFEKE